MAKESKQRKNPKAGQNMAKDVETVKPITSKSLTGKQLVDQLNKNYQTIAQAQTNIRELNAELERRLKIKE